MTPLGFDNFATLSNGQTVIFFRGLRSLSHAWDKVINRGRQHG
jgi:hypothetical protein